MRNLFKWEMKHTFSSKAFWGMGIALTAAIVLMSFASLSEAEYTGFDVFIQGCSNFNSLMVLSIGIYSGIHVAGAFEERRIQAAVMAGNSRFSVLTAKLISFSLSIAFFCAASFTVIAVIAFGAKGMAGFEGSFLREVIVRAAVYTLVEVSFVSVCFMISMFVKNLGASIAGNFVALVGLNSLAPELLGKKWAEGILEFTPVGQTFILLADAGTKNLVVSVAASLLGLAATIVISYVKFRKEELK